MINNSSLPNKLSGDQTSQIIFYRKVVTLP